jgi:hypothetical protein
MAGEVEAPVRRPQVGSIRYKDDTEAEAFMALFERYKAKGRCQDVSGFIRYLFRYANKNPYSDPDLK